MPIFRIRVERDHVIVEGAEIDVEASDSAAAADEVQKLFAAIRLDDGKALATLGGLAWSPQDGAVDHETYRIVGSAVLSNEQSFS